MAPREPRPLWGLLLLIIRLMQVTAASEPSLAFPEHLNSNFAIPSCEKIAMLKSLKTGSTTFANILFRVAVSRGMRVLRQDEGPDLSVNYTLPSARDPPMDMVISHIRGGCVQPREFPKLMSFYEEVRHCCVAICICIVCPISAACVRRLRRWQPPLPQALPLPPLMPHPPRPFPICPHHHASLPPIHAPAVLVPQVLGTDDFTLLTTVREPVSRYLSHIKYFTFQSLKERTGRDYKLSEIVAEKKLFNVLSCVFGIYNMEDALAFIQGPIF